MKLVTKCRCLSHAETVYCFNDVFGFSLGTLVEAPEALTTLFSVEKRHSIASYTRPALVTTWAWELLNILEFGGGT